MQTVNPKNAYQEVQAGNTEAYEKEISSEAINHQLTIEPVGETTTGSMAIGVKAFGALDYTSLRDSAGDVLALDMTAGSQTITFTGRFVGIVITPSEDFDGDSFNVVSMGW